MRWATRLWYFAAGIIMTFGIASELRATTGSCMCSAQVGPMGGAQVQCNGGSCSNCPGSGCTQGGDWKTYFVCICTVAGVPCNPGATWCRLIHWQDGTGAWHNDCPGGCPSPMTCGAGSDPACSNSTWTQCVCN
jgi:hypothetical protein